MLRSGRFSLVHGARWIPSGASTSSTGGPGGVCIEPFALHVADHLALPMSRRFKELPVDDLHEVRVPDAFPEALAIRPGASQRHQTALPPEVETGMILPHHFPCQMGLAATGKNPARPQAARSCVQSLDLSPAIRGAGAGPEPDTEAIFPIAVRFPPVIIGRGNSHFPAIIRSPRMAPDATIALNPTL